MARPHAALPTAGSTDTTEAAKRRAAIARLHIAKKERAIDDDDWRDVMERVTGKRSLKELDVRQLYTLLDELHGRGAARAPSKIAGPYAAKLRAMWISGWHLGVIRDNSDAALVAFVKRQTGLDAVRFLREAQAAARAIEALKSWLDRAGGVEWSAHPDNPRAAIVDAQWRRLVDLRAIGFYRRSDTPDDGKYHYAHTVTGKTGPQFYTEEDWDKLIAALGAKLRHELAKSGPTEL